MSAGTELLKNGPIVLLEQIAATHPKGGSADMRALLTIHVRGGKTWTGVPTNFIPTRDQNFITLETHGKKNLVSLSVNEIQAIEFENLDSIFSFFERPWQRDDRFRSLSRLQLQRETESLWKFIPNQKLTLEIDSFPAVEDTPGALLAWVEMLKGEIEALMTTSVGAEAIQTIQNISVAHGDEDIDLKKQDKNLIFKVSLNKKSFDRSQIAKLLNDNL